MSIYERIESLIKSKAMTKKEFCKELGISTGNLGDWKRGKSSPGTNKLIDIAAYFDVSLDWLMTGREREAVQVHEEREAYAADEPDWIRLSSRLTEREKAFIQEYLEFTEYRRKIKRMGGK
ncbi:MULTISPECIES: helix-turn-helix domain-containing protein [Paenibacillus]|uniref:Helix-turn-helix domain-containing protein n=1 Tax=Paenibacillus woosongensis TaxID=307580 RepID=A0A7X3CLI9_9BACL|nr:helix-turn-helix transcriptional regulator [Paenibacillus woosongensis]MUG44050.1 helix-turn-helix domain-containing protein [Paenibacillus woosongensis]